MKPRLAPCTWSWPSAVVWRWCQAESAPAGRSPGRGSTVPTTRPRPSAAHARCDVSQCRGTTLSASVLATHKERLPMPAAHAAAASTPSDLATPTQPARVVTATTPSRARTTRSEPSRHASRTTTTCVGTSGWAVPSASTAAATASRQAGSRTSSSRAGTTTATASGRVTRTVPARAAGSRAPGARPAPDLPQRGRRRRTCRGPPARPGASRRVGDASGTGARDRRRPVR